MLTYVKAALPLIPLASRLPFVAGGGGEIPTREVTRTVTPDADAVAAYARVCGFDLRSELPPTYPHVLAFGLHMDLMTSGDFPFGAIGLVHLANAITVRRPLSVGEPLEISVRAGSLHPHAKGRTFTLVTSVSAGGSTAWEGVATILRRGPSNQPGRETSHSETSVGPVGGGCTAPVEVGRETSHSETLLGPVELPERAEWRLGGDLGRRYASVSGDHNPIHLHALSAKALGFPRAIAHGMWTKARCLAALKLPDAFTAEVAFKRPILLPATVTFAADGDAFEVRGRDQLHLQGTVTP